MKTFTEELWGVLAEQHGASTAVRGRRPRKLTGARALKPAAAAVIVLAAAAFAVFGIGGGGAQPAYALETAANGTVTLTVAEVTGVQEANSALAKLGIPVVVARFDPGCTQTGQLAPPAERAQVMSIVETTPPHGQLQSLRWIIHPQLIPSGDVLRLVAHFLAPSEGHALGVSYTLYRGAAPTCAAGPT
jgi:hypothetical protein